MDDATGRSPPTAVARGTDEGDGYASGHGVLPGPDSSGDVGPRQARVLVEGEHGVGVEVGERRADPGVERGRDPGVGLPDDADARAFLEGRDDLESRRGPVVDDHHARDLGPDVVDELGQPRPGIERRDDGHHPEVRGGAPLTTRTPRPNSDVCRFPAVGA